jgi:class 3 adenylate cyclase/tetratricopeptide (TPR) repeat protein
VSTRLVDANKTNAVKPAHSRVERTCAVCHAGIRAGAGRYRIGESEYHPDCFGGALEFWCPSCRHANAVGSLFCNACGQPLEAFGPAPPRFGSPLAYTPKHLAEKILRFKSAVEGERKQVTVLFCDIVDSTALVHRLGPEGMHALLSDFFELVLGEVHRYEGTINQFLGDGFMALFGAPIAYEDHARRGVLAAWAIHQRLQEEHRSLRRWADAKLSVRMGLNTGAVVVGKIGDNLRMDYAAVGDTTHLAARLQQMAPPDAIVMSETTFSLVRGLVHAKWTETVSVKGAQPVSAYEMMGVSPRRLQRELGTDSPLSPFVGRDRELVELNRLLGSATEGHGKVVAVVGEPGTGKSRLLLEFQRVVTGQPVAYVEGRCLSYGSAVPYLPLLDHIRNICGINESDPREVIADKIRSTLQDMAIESEAAPYVLHAFGVPSDPDILGPLTAEAIRARTFEIIRQLLLHASARRPIVLVVEDLHWIDKTSEDFLAAFARVVGDARLMLITTYRPGNRARWVEKSSATQLLLRPLSDVDSLAVVRSILGPEPVSTDVMQHILERAEGNPFFLEELARAVRQHRDLVIPETIEALLMARIDRLSQDAKQLLQYAAVVGREVSRPLLEAVWQGPIDVAIAELQELEFLSDVRVANETRYVFKHALIQEVAYEALLTVQRQALHAAAGRALEVLHAGSLDDVYDRLAYHYARTEEARKAVEYLKRFARRAARGYSHAEAAATLAEALTHAGRLPEGERDPIVLELVLRQVQSLNFLGRNQESLALLLAQRERLARVADAAQSGRYHFALGLTYNFVGDRDGSAENVQRALEEAERAGDDRTTGRACALLTLESYWSGRPHEGLERGRRALALLERTRQPYWLAQTHFYMAINYYLMGALDHALEAARRADTVGEAVGDASIRSYAASTLGGIHAAAGNFEAAMVAGQRGVELAPDPLSRAQALGFHGYACLEQGDAARAIPLLRDAAEQMGRFRYRQLHGWFTALLGESTLVAGKLDEARDLMNQGLDMTRQAKYWLGVGWAERGLGRLACATGDHSAARKWFMEALRTFDSVDAGFEVARTELALAELAATADNVHVAGQHLTAAHRRFVELNVTTYVGRAEQLAAAMRQPLDVRA